MRLILIALFITLPYFSFSQGFTIKVGVLELPIDKIPDTLDLLPERVDKIQIKKDKAENTPNPFFVQVGEEEHQFLPDGAYQEILFTHDIEGLVVAILDDRRAQRGRPFKLKKPQKGKK